MKSSIKKALTEGLRIIPDSWQLTPVGANKQPILKDWQHSKTTLAELTELIESGSARGYGLVLGEASLHQGMSPLLAVDFDGLGTDELAVELNGGNPLPDTVAWTSGREGRHQRLYCVPIDYWGELQGHAQFTAESGSKLELRYNGHQSVLPPSQHPETGRYKWLTPPAEIEGFDKIAYAKIPYAPQWMIDSLLIDQRPVEQISSSNPESDRAWAIEYMSAIATGYPSDDYQDWIRVGMALKSLGDDLFPLWDSWSSTSAKYDGGKIQKKWDGFKPQKNGIATLGWFAKKAGWVPKTPKKSGAEMSQTNGRAAAVADEVASQQGGQPVKTAQNSKKGRKSPRWLMLQFLPLQPELEGIRFNLKTERIEIKGKPLNDQDLKDLRENIEVRHDGSQILEPYEDFKDCVHSLARGDSYHPIKDYLKGCYDKNLGKVSRDIFEQFLTQGLRVKSDPLYTEFLEKTMIGAVKRIFEPGCKHDYALILQGRQGARKSTLFRVLAGDEWFTDSLADIKSKDELSKLLSHWIIELPEIERITTRRADGDIKSFLSRQEDSFRKPYFRSVEDFPRSCIIVGSVNQIEFLKDPTGSRRYWIIPGVDWIDIEWVKAHRDQLWGAALALYRAGVPNYLTEAQDEYSQQRNQTYALQDEWAGVIMDYCEIHKRVTLRELLEKVGVDISLQSQQQQNRVKAILVSNGYESRQGRLNGKISRFWAKKQESVPPVTGCTASCTASKPIYTNGVPPVPPVFFKGVKKQESEGVGDSREPRDVREMAVQAVQAVHPPLKPTADKDSRVYRLASSEAVQGDTGGTPLQLGQRIYVTPADAIGTLKDIDLDFEKPCSVDFESPTSQGLLTARYCLTDLRAVNEETR